MAGGDEHLGEHREREHGVSEQQQAPRLGRTIVRAGANAARARTKVPNTCPVASAHMSNRFGDLSSAAGRLPYRRLQAARIASPHASSRSLILALRRKRKKTR
jgi:hypothetical protein